jgi:dienelactone hydrolase
MIEKMLDYEHDGSAFEAYVAFNGSTHKPRPAILIAHTWEGRGEFVCDKARILAGEGYIACAIDLYGKGVLGSGPDENAKLMQPCLDDRNLLQARMLRALSAVQQLDEVNETKVAAIGYCFGGLCVLDLARAGAPVKGVVSFHGLLGAPGNMGGNPITAKVLILHGNDDPMATADDVFAIENELSAAGADWQLHAYGNTMHSFTNPNANNRAMGTVYNETADHRSWVSMMSFLREILK